MAREEGGQEMMVVDGGKGVMGVEGVEGGKDVMDVDGFGVGDSVEALFKNGFW